MYGQTINMPNHVPIKASGRAVNEACERVLRTNSRNSKRGA